MQQLPVQASLIRLIAHRQIHPGLLIQNGLIMTKGIKAGLPVVGAHSTFPDTAEAHVGSGKMDHHIIDSAAAITAPLGHFTDNLFVFGEDI